MVSLRLSLAAVALVSGATLALGVLVEAGGRQLGTATPPLIMGWSPEAQPAGVVVAVLVCAVVVALMWRLGPFGLLAASAATVLAVNAMRTGTDGWSAVFSTSFEAKNEYLPGLPALQYGRDVFLDRFAEWVPALPVNVAGHPPGLILTLDVFGLTTAGRMAALCIACAAAIAPLSWLLARRIGLTEEQARVAGLLALASPAVLLIGGTSADAVYAAIGAGTAVLLATRGGWRVAGCLALAVAALFSWALLAVGAWGAVLAWRREGLRAALLLAAGCAVAVLALQGALAAAYGYDPIAALRNTEAVYRESLAQIRPYWYWVVGSPVAWALMSGLPTVAAIRWTPAGSALLVVLLVAAVAGFTKAETERIWLIFVPLACVAAAEVVPRSWVRPVVALLLAQALACQVLFDTVW